MTAEDARDPTYADHDVDVARERALAAVEHLAASVREAADAAARRASPGHRPVRSPAGVPEAAWALSPDDWWDQLSHARRLSVQHWLDPPPAPLPPMTGQLDALDHLTQHDDS